MTKRAIIIDDERLARAELKKLLQDHPEIEVIAEAANANEGIEKIEHMVPDLVFLDIQMPGKTGFDLLTEIDRMPQVIFTTAYDEYALKAFEVNALDYLLKPVEPKRLADALHKLEYAEEREALAATTQGGSIVNRGVLGENDQVFVKDGEKCWFVKLGKIRLFESMGNYVRLHFDDQKPLVLKSLNNLEERLDPNTYFRANRKHIINLHWIEKIEPWFSGGLLVTLQGGDKIEISRRQAIRFKELMSL